MILTRPLVGLDVEATGVSVTQDRITSMSFVKVHPDGSRQTWSSLINPERDIPQEVQELTGITNEMVLMKPKFSEVTESFMPFISGCDLAGFNLWNYDLPIISEELSRCGLELNLQGVRVLDAGNIFKKKEERTLSAALKFYCNREHDGAHEAEADVLATLDVLEAQIDRYDDLAFMSLDDLHLFSQHEERADIAGKIVKNKNGDWVYSFGDKTRGKRVVDDPGFASWMITKDFPANTKKVLRQILNGQL